MTRRRLRYVAPVLTIGLVVVAGCQAPQEAEDPGPPEFPREETVITTGAEWGTYSNWNPLHGGGQATYVMQGIYETLFVFDPWTAELEPWLAEEGDWVSDTEYLLTLREGATWHDGEPVTADDVVYTVDLREEPGIPYATLSAWLDEAVAEDERTVRFTFSEQRRGEWENWLYNNPIVPEHAWGDLAGEELMAAGGEDRVVGTGALKYVRHTEERATFERYDEWWAIEALGMQMQPRYVIDRKNQSNEVVIPQLQRGEIDLSNNFVPGVQFLDGFGGETISTFYPEDPYMIPSNTVHLVPNHTREPMDDPQLRRALAFSIDIDTIVDTVYHNIVQPAHPTGLMDIWSDHFDEDVVAEHGFSYNPEEARRILAEAGYQDSNGDGFVETTAGEEFELTLIAPRGWTDWNEAVEVVAGSARAVGINVVADFPGDPELGELRDAGTFDLVLNNDSGLSNTPAEHFSYLFRLPIEELQSAHENIGRYENPDAWELTEQLWAMSIEDEGFQDILSQLQAIALQEMPAIPLWYNGLWSQVNSSVWTNWPSADEDTPSYYPSTWANIGSLKGYLMFTELEPADP